MKAGLRVDVDTYRGTKRGVPRLVEILARHRIAGTFFFTVGPDNMGRHLWRLLRPEFARKMLRTRGPSLYGWDILFRGTLWPGTRIGQGLEEVIRVVADLGHELGLHAWDHHRWQARLRDMTEQQIRVELRQGFDELSRILQRAPTCSAAPGWVCNEQALRVKAEFPFAYNSDCRGRTPFRPVVDGEPLAQPQIPATLPTYDELVGRDGVNDENYNDRLLMLFEDERLNVLTIHAEVEGIACAEMFERFLNEAAQRGIEFVPLHQLVGDPGSIAPGAIVDGAVHGREGTVAVQAALTPDPDPRG